MIVQAVCYGLGSMGRPATMPGAEALVSAVQDDNNGVNAPQNNIHFRLPDQFSERE